MFLFAIVFRHPDTCGNYQHLSMLLERSLRSACNQVDQQFNIVVVCNQQPEMEFHDPRIVFKVVDLPIPQSRHEVLLDKGVKRLVALQYAIEQSISHFMTLDGDDLVSAQLLTKVKGYLSKNPNGLFFSHGYLLDFNNQRLQEKFGFNHYCGSSLVLNVELVMQALNCSAEQLLSCHSYNEFLEQCSEYHVKELLGDHRQAKPYFKGQNTPLSEVSEAMAVWVVNNGENVSKTTIGAGSKSITAKFIAEFGLQHSLSASSAPLLERLIERVRFIKSWCGETVRSSLAK